MYYTLDNHRIEAITSAVLEFASIHHYQETLSKSDHKKSRKTRSDKFSLDFT